jgi:Zn-dependent protease
MDRIFTTEKLLGLANLMTVVILSTACHEFAHALTADHFGDQTPRRAGRITFNPFAHIHPIYTVALPAILYLVHGGFMAAAFTPVNPKNMRNPRLHGLLTALAGPATNLLLAVVGFVALAVLIFAVGGLGPESPRGTLHVFSFFEMAVRLNLLLALFNFLPIPPLDGSDLVGFVLPGRLRAWWYGVRSYATMLFVILLFTGCLEFLIGPALDGANGVLDAGIRLVNGLAHG